MFPHIFGNHIVLALLNQVLPLDLNLNGASVGLPALNCNTCNLSGELLFVINSQFRCDKSLRPV